MYNEADITLRTQYTPLGAKLHLQLLVLRLQKLRAPFVKYLLDAEQFVYPVPQSKSLMHCIDARVVCDHKLQLH